MPRHQYRQFDCRRHRKDSRGRKICQGPAKRRPSSGDFEPRGQKRRSTPQKTVWENFLSQGSGIPPRVVSDGKSVLLDSATAGDEPYMLASNLRGVAVVVDKERVKGGLHALKELGVDTLLLDD